MLTVSFPSDQANIGAYSNGIGEKFDSVADRREWQTAALRAFQTWAVETNLNIGLKADRGDHFGAVGLSQGDPRFGDFRIGAFPQDGVLANALPYQTVAGTWAGDVLLNTQVNYFLGDWEDESEIEVPQPNKNGPAVELFSVLLHEAGNALGLADVEKPGAVMHKNYEGPKGRLTGADEQAIESLYGGPRRDIYEPSPNDKRHSATWVQHPDGFDGAQPLTFRGSLNTQDDVDVYRLNPLPGEEKMTVRLRASEISLVKARLQLLDHAGNLIADTSADSIFNNDLELQIPSLERHPSLYVRVQPNSDDVFGVGDYEIQIDYRSPLRPSDDNAETEDGVESDDSDDFETEDDDDELVDVIFSAFGLVDQEAGSNDSLTSATALDPVQGFLTGTRYQAQGALRPGDVDYLSFRTADIIDGPVSVQVQTLGLETPILHADVLDGSGNRVLARANPQSDGSVSFEVINPVPSTEYFIRLQVALGSTVSEGNYMVTIDAATGANVGGILLDSTAVSGSANWTPIWVAKTQLFRFDLSAPGQRTRGGVEVAIYEPRFGTVVTSFAVAGDRSVTAFKWLQRGRYFVRVKGLDRDALLQQEVAYTLSATGLSDDQGPLADNPVDPLGAIPADPLADGNPIPDPFRGSTPVIYPLPDPYGGSNPFLDPSLNSSDPNGGGYEPTSDPDPWYLDPYYDPYLGASLV